jgi:hypothetical protein
LLVHAEDMNLRIAWYLRHHKEKQRLV